MKIDWGLARITLIAFALGACDTTSTYREPNVPESKASFVQRSYKHGTTVDLVLMIPVAVPRHLTTITALDSKQIPITSMTHNIRVLPGKHTAEVHYIGRSIMDVCGTFGCMFEHQSDLSIDFISEEGHEYRIPVESGEKRDYIWVEDVATGNIVAGERPAPEPAR